MMRILLSMWLFMPVLLQAQELLVNRSFEEENYCTEYDVNCAPEGWIYTIPSFNYYFKDGKLAHTGYHFISLIAGNSKKEFYRSYVRSRLLCGLRKGNIYRLQFFVKSRHPVLDSIGVYFSTDDFLFEKRVYWKIEPSVYLANALTKPAKDSNWQKIVLDYKAKGDESFITLGNFSKRDIRGATGIPLEDNFFVSFDDISLMPLNRNEKLCNNWEQTRDEIYQQDERHEFLDRMIRYNRNKPPQDLKPSLTIVRKIDTVIVPDILFETGRFQLSQQAHFFLDSISRSLSSVIIDSVGVEGHTDSVGSVEDNRVLGQNRANEVAGYLRMKFPSTKFTARSWASERPVADNRTAVGRQRNRRVEIYLYIRE